MQKLIQQIRIIKSRERNNLIPLLAESSAMMSLNGNAGHWATLRIRTIRKHGAIHRQLKEMLILWLSIIGVFVSKQLVIRIIDLGQARSDEEGEKLDDHFQRGSIVFRKIN
jgi:hypothetical protein